MSQLVKKIYFGLAVLIGLLIVFKSLDYFDPDFTNGFLIGKKSIFDFYKFFLYAHIIGSPIALITGIFQFTKTWSKIHRPLGKIYIASVVLLAAPGALLMSFFSIGGMGSTINFLLLSVLWLFFTIKAYHYIKGGEVDKHKRMMIRSFILTNSAIWIRILSYLNNQFQMVEPDLGYVIISWLSWAPALLAYELMAMRQQPKTDKTFYSK